MQFVHQALTWGFLLALVPLLIHLINLMRHKRVQWAAMEFLLASYKKHRKWVWLKQLLLLLSRMAVIGLIVAMLAQLKTKDQWLALFAGKPTHHYIVLDDSYSMSDRVAGASAMDAARQVITAIASRSEQDDRQQKLTLIRYSRARHAGTPDRDGAAQLADFNAEPIEGEFDVTLESRLRTMEPTQLALGPREALAVLKPLLTSAPDETSIVYLLSDFREKDWESPVELRESLQDLKRSQATVHLVNCSRATDPNVGILSIEPADETRAAGVPLFVNVKVKNHGLRAVSRVQLKVQSTFFPPESLQNVDPEKLLGVTEDLATLLIDEIGPGEVVTRRVQVYFPQPGKHVIEAILPEDPVEADNRRWVVIDFPDGERTLVIDGTDDQLHSYYVEAAFRPLQRSNTGIRPEVQPASYLRDVAPEALRAYSTVFLLDVPRLDNTAVDKLEEYVRSGGGLAIFTGPQTNIAFYNSALYKEGLGLLPVPMGVENNLPPVLDGSEPDLELLPHPVFAFFQNEANPLIRGVKIDTYRAPAPGWKPDPDRPVEVVARLRDKSPLVIEKKYGAGTVMQFTTTCGPVWNDWAKNPSFVVVLLKLQSYLAAPQRLDDERTVGTPLELSLPASEYVDELQFVVPGEKAGTRRLVKMKATAAEGDAGQWRGTLGQSAPRDGSAAGTDRRGIYEAWALSSKGEVELRRYALNVDPDEGNLANLDPGELVSKLDPVQVEYHLADQYQQEDVAASGYNLSYLIMGALVLLLVGEQMLAYSSSFHTARGAAR
jgi:hypothetical protein